MSNSEKVKAELLQRIDAMPLADTDDILTELRQLYRDARRGKLDIGISTKLTYILKVMSEIMTLQALEKRIDYLESGRPYLPSANKSLPAPDGATNPDVN